MQEKLTPTYTAGDIVILEGLDAVRKRPGMYIGGVHKAGLHHLLWEIVDNAIDEAMNGHADTIEIRLHPDGRSVSVKDNGRGIPFDIHPKHGRPTLELILTTLHSGGKFEGKNYKHSGGLHGVGLSVVNALSSQLTVEIQREGRHVRQEYAYGRPTTAIQVLKKGVSSTGTTVTFTPDPAIFQGYLDFEPALIRERLQIRAYLHRKLKIVFSDEAAKTEDTFLYEGGIEDYLRLLLSQKRHAAVHEGFFSLQIEEDPCLEVAFCWTEATDETFLSFANGIPTKSGGTHENGLKAAIIRAIRAHMTLHKLLPKGMQVTAEDIREGLVGLISLYLGDPQFQGQTKERLNNPEVQAHVEQAVKAAFEHWLNEKMTVSKQIVARILLAAKARAASRAASQVIRRQSPTRRLNLPGKLADCSEQAAEKCEIFIVEGDSAGGSAKMGRDRKTQAILPLRGKVLNTETANLKKVLENKEISDIVQALGCGIGQQFQIENLRYHKIILLMDADADGHHISTLLLTFFYRHLPGLIQSGHVFLAQPPLYKIEVGKKVFWALDEDQRDAVLSKASKGAKIDIQRFKGLGEMMPQVLRETTLDPKQRTLLRIHVDDPLGTDVVISELFGRDANARFRFITERAHEVDEIDLTDG